MSGKNNKNEHVSKNNKNEHEELLIKIHNLEKELQIVNMQLASYQSITIRQLQLKRQMAFQLHKKEWNEIQFHSNCPHCGNISTCAHCGNILAKINSSKDETDSSMDISSPAIEDYVEDDYDVIDHSCLSS